MINMFDETKIEKKVEITEFTNFIKEYNEETN
jgi:hypothetical protein